MRIIKLAKTYDVYYSVGFSPEIKKKRVEVKPSRMPSGMTEMEYVEHLLDRQESEKVIIENMISLGNIRRKRGPSQEDLQHMRGEKMRKKREKRQRQQQQEEYLRQKSQELGLDPNNIDPRLLNILLDFERLESNTPDVNILDLLKSRKAS